MRGVRVALPPEILPALGVVDHFDQFPGAADPALTVLSRV
jgi:hypothetical protein